MILATILLIGSGVYATTRLNQELLPDISFPIITISTPVAGAGPDLVDEQVTQPVEDAINGCRGSSRSDPPPRRGSPSWSSSSTSTPTPRRPSPTSRRPSTAYSFLRRQEIPRSRASRLRSLILSLSLAAEDQDLADLTSYAEDEVVPSIEEVQGVASVDVIGGAEKRIQVDLDPDKIKEKGLSTDAVVGALSGAEVDAPVGSVTVNGRETPVNTSSELGGISASRPSRRSGRRGPSRRGLRRSGRCLTRCCSSSR